MKHKIQNFAKNFLSFYEEVKNDLNNTTSHIDISVRENAFNLFKENKVTLPDNKQESYKYSNLKKHLKHDFIFYSTPEKPRISVQDTDVCNINELDAYSAVLINGWFFDKDNGLLHTTPEGIVYGSITEAYNNGYKELIDSHFNKETDNNDPLLALNNLFAQDGLFEYVQKNVVSNKPFQLINLVTALEEVFISPHNLIIADENSQIKFLLCEHSIFPKYFLNNSITQIFAKENANIEYIRLQNAHNESFQFTSTFINQSSDSTVKTNTITLHGGVVRNNIITNLNGNNCHNEMNGLALVDKGQHVDNWILINHNEPYSSSRELFKNISDDYATGVFSGKIYVAKDAQKTDAEQTNKNILLTSDAKVYSKPQLEIYADDVVCSHGSATGQIDEEQLFYMRQRGIAQKEARLILLNAFAYEVIKDISIETIKNEVIALVDKRLSGDLSRCDKCEIKC